MMSEGGFNLRKWVTNCPELSRRIRIVESVLDGPSVGSGSQSQFPRRHIDWVCRLLDFSYLIANVLLPGFSMLNPIHHGGEVCLVSYLK